MVRALQVAFPISMVTVTFGDVNETLSEAVGTAPPAQVAVWLQLPVWMAANALETTLTVGELERSVSTPPVLPRDCTANVLSSSAEGVARLLMVIVPVFAAVTAPLLTVMT